MNLREYQSKFAEISADFEAALEEYGVPFEARESSPRSERARIAGQCGCHCENGNASLWRVWISPACLRCRTSERTASLFVDLRCTRSCYFCFNPNQAYYDYFHIHTRNITMELEQAYEAGAQFDCLAVTGGEPMLHREKVIEFFDRAKELYPAVHTRLYTNGDLLDDRNLFDLANAGLDEIRFSVKPLDAGGGRDRLFDLASRANRFISDVVIEMPVIPGTSEEMKSILLEADEVGIRGINLLEMGFPLNNAEEFCAKGLLLRKHPFRYVYNYNYGGGVPVAGSEAESLSLLEFADSRQLNIGVHYCSADNRNSGQVYLQNKAFDNDRGLRKRFAWLEHDEGDRFLKCAKAFGSDVSKVRAWADELGGIPYGIDEEIPCIAFPLARVEEMRESISDVAVGISVNVIEELEPGEYAVIEVAVEDL